MKKINLSDEQINFIILCFDYVISNNGKLTKDVQIKFNEKYPNVKIGYATLRKYYEQNKNNSATFGLKRIWSRE